MITIVGPTASGKTRLAVDVALAYDTEVISADSRQVYRGMTLGTGKDLDDYVVRNADGQVVRTVPCHLIDIHEPGYKYNIFEYQKDFHRVYDDMMARGKVPVLCGGSGLYVESVLRGYRMGEVPPDPDLRQELAGKTLEELTEILKTYKVLHNTTDTDTPQRAIREIEIRRYYQEHAATMSTFPPVPSLVVGIDVDRDLRRERITRRLHERLKQGMVDEVRGLLDKVPADDLIYYGLEYKYVTLYVTGQLHYDEMVRQLEIAIHQFAKRQMTWFRGMERRGVQIHWIDSTVPADEKVRIVEKLYAQFAQK